MPPVKDHDSHSDLTRAKDSESNDDDDGIKSNDDNDGSNEDNKSNDTRSNL